jgi:hypothetical protein
MVSSRGGTRFPHGTGDPMDIVEDVMPLLLLDDDANAVITTIR